MRLPGDKDQTFLILRPFVPTKGNNQQMTAFMVAKSDPENYGQLQTFVMPGNNPPPSPTLVASTMGSDTAVSSLQTLLVINTGGSRLLFGNLLIVPIDQSLLYVRPVYVQASGDQNPPLLRKVVVEFNNQVQVADTLAGALKLFPAFADFPAPGATVTPVTPGQTETPAAPASVSELLARAIQAFDDADAALANKDLKTYAE